MHDYTKHGFMHAPFKWMCANLQIVHSPLLGKDGGGEFEYRGKLKAVIEKRLCYMKQVSRRSLWVEIKITAGDKCPFTFWTFLIFA